MPRNLYASELREGTAIVLVTLTFGSREHRLSEYPVTVTSGSGTSYPYDGGLLGADISTALGLMGSEADLLSVPISCVLSVDVGALRAQGHQLAGQPVEVAIWVPGTTLESRRVLVAGRVSQPTWGAQGEPVNFSADESPYTDTGTLILPTEVFTAAAYETAYGGAADPRNDGAIIPFAWGRPGVCIVNGVLGSIPAVPVVVTAYDVLDGANYGVICSGHATGETIVLFDDTGASEDFSLNKLAELGVSFGAYGQEIQGVGPLYPFLTTIDSTTDLYWAAKVADPAGGGPAFRRPGLPARGLGEVLCRILTRASMRIDWGRWDAVRPLLDRYEVAGYAADPEVSAWKVIVDRFLPLFPFSVRAGPDGLYPVVWRYDATANDAIGHLNAGPGTDAIRSGPVEEYPDPGDLCSEVSIAFALNLQTGEYTRAVTHGPPTAAVMGGPPSTEESTHVELTNMAGGAVSFTTTITVDPLWSAAKQTSAYAMAAGTTIASAQAKTIETDIIYDDSTAAAVADWMIRAYSMPRRKIPYDLDARWLWLDVGDVLTLTDAELSISGAPCLVLEASASVGGAVAVVLLVLDDPIGRGHGL